MPQKPKRRILSVYVNLGDREFDLPDYLDGEKFIISVCPASVSKQTTSKGLLSGDSIKKIKELNDSVDKFVVELAETIKRLKAL